MFTLAVTAPARAQTMQSAHYLSEPQTVDYGGGTAAFPSYSARDSIGGSVNGESTGGERNVSSGFLIPLVEENAPDVPRASSRSGIGNSQSILITKITYERDAKGRVVLFFTTNIPTKGEVSLRAGNGRTVGELTAALGTEHKVPLGRLGLGEYRLTFVLTGEAGQTAAFRDLVLLVSNEKRPRRQVVPAGMENPPTTSPSWWERLSGSKESSAKGSRGSSAAGSGVANQLGLTLILVSILLLIIAAFLREKQRRDRNANRGIDRFLQ